MLPTGPLRADQASLAEEPPLRVMSLGQSGTLSCGPDGLLCHQMGEESVEFPVYMFCKRSWPR